MPDNPNIAVSKKEQVDQVKKILTDDFYRKLVKYGIVRLNFTFNIKYDIERGFRGILIEDIISETLESFTKENGRTWNKAKFPKFESQVISAFDSCLHNTVRKEFEKAKDSVPLTEEDNLASYSSIEYNDMLQILIEALDSLGATQVEKDIFEPYFIHKMKREDVAELLGIEVQEVTNAKKRIDRKLPSLRCKLKVINDEK